LSHPKRIIKIVISAWIASKNVKKLVPINRPKIFLKYKIEFQQTKYRNLSILPKNPPTDATRSKGIAFASCVISVYLKSLK